MSGTSAEVALVSVNVAFPSVIGHHGGEEVRSGIDKRPVSVASLMLDNLNLEGDGQADLEVHGGVDKAVYAYPSEHLGWWSAELGQDLGPAAFGENLTVAGWLEGDVCIGDRWSWGEAVLEVCQPRWPCFKLGIHRGDDGVVAAFRRSGRTGWYLRVLQPGMVPVAGPVEVLSRHPEGVTVAECHVAAVPGAMAIERLVEVAGLEPLAEEWRHTLARRIVAAARDQAGG